MDSQILFEDPDIEMRDSDDDLLDECSQMFIENPIPLALPPGSGSEVKESKDGISYMDSLPEEILVKILGYLTQNEMCRVARVAKKWNECIKYPRLWKKADVKLFQYHESQHQLAINIVLKRLPSSATHLKLDFCICRGEDNELNFKKFSMALLFRCPDLKTLILHHAQLSESLSSVIYLCSQKLKSLRVLILNESEFSFYPSIERNALVSDIEVLDVSDCKNVFFDEFIFSKMPQLKKLRLTATDVCDYMYDYFYTSFFNHLQVLDVGHTAIDYMAFNTIKNCGLHLTELYMCGAHLNDSHLKVDGSYFPCLQTLCLGCCEYISCMVIVFLVHTCPSLQNLYVDEDMAQSFANADKCHLGIVKVSPSCDYHEAINYLQE